MAFRYDPGKFLLQPGITMLAGSGTPSNFLPGEKVKIDAGAESRHCIGWSPRSNLGTARYIASHHRTCTDYLVEEPHDAEGVTRTPFASDGTVLNNHFGTWEIQLIWSLDQHYIQRTYSAMWQMQGLWLINSIIILSLWCVRTVWS
jgi:hypothetical protein